ncbi:MAG: hypothetical protein J5I99_03820 [Verrucomicrobia bacterium]|nr:hypothetical protein [Kiritimatiellia bacterium]MCO6400340.1 hypothetical protein [Verrucomicrobiota bacterium]
MSSTVQRIVLLALGLLFLFTLAMGARMAILEAQYKRFGDELPFTLESALHYRRVKMVYDTGRIQAHDAMVQFPEGIDPRTTYTLGAEYFYAALAKYFPSHIPVPTRVRILEAGWFSLGIPFLALGLYGWRRNLGAAVWGSLFYAISLSSVIRSTGQELSHENFALPFLIGHWALLVWSPEVRSRWLRVGGQSLAALLLGWALCSWDMVQFYIALRLLLRVWREVRASVRPSLIREGWWLEYAALIAVGLFNPYHREQGWLLSPTMGLAHAIVLLRIARCWLDKPGGGWNGVRVRLGIVVFGFLAVWGAHFLLPASGAYGHFAELLWAKLRYFNMKPADPARLTFAQRILWVPALNSTDWRLAAMLFPTLLLLTIPAVLLALVHARRGFDFRIGELLFAWAVSVAAFWLFTRFHVYLSLFSCMLIGVGWSLLPSPRRGMKILVGLALGAGLLVEGVHTLRRPEQWGRVNVYFKEISELTAWLSRHVAPEAVLANFGTSASIAAYGKCAIVLHPKFENTALRQRVKEYGEELFLKDEKSFRDWAVAHGARYYVYAFGEFSSVHPELQMRYFVNALNPPDHAAARGFEFHPDDTTWFVPLWRNMKYSAYRIISPADEVRAGQDVKRAEAALERGDLKAASQFAAAALESFPRQPRAVEILRVAGTLQAEGFQGERALR